MTHTHTHQGEKLGVLNSKPRLTFPQSAPLCTVNKSVFLCYTTADLSTPSVVRGPEKKFSFNSMNPVALLKYDLNLACTLWDANPRPSRVLASQQLITQFRLQDKDSYQNHIFLLYILCLYFIYILYYAFQANPIENHSQLIILPMVFYIQFLTAAIAHRARTCAPV